MDLDEKSKRKLIGVHPDLVQVIELAAKKSTLGSFIVTEGLRTLDRQKQLFLEKKTKTLNSRHITGHAVDLAVWFDKDLNHVTGVDELSWKFSDYKNLADIVKEAAKELEIPIEWGGDWKTFKDGPHFQLPFKEYPA